MVLGYWNMVPVVGPADLMTGFGGSFGVVWPELVSLRRGDILGGWIGMLEQQRKHLDYTRFNLKFIPKFKSAGQLYNL